MPTIAALTSFTANTQAKAAEVNANFSTIRTTVNTYAAFVDSTATITGAWTFSTAPVFTNAQTFASAVTVTSGGLTVTAGGLTVSAGASAFGGGVAVTGNSTVAGTLTGMTGITATGAVDLSAGNLTLTTGQGVTAQYDAGNSSTALIIDFNNGNAQKCVLTGNCVLTFSNPVAGASYVLMATQDGTGGRTLTFPSTVRWEGGTPSLLTTSTRASVFAFYYTGSRYIGSVIGTGVDVS